MNCRNLDETTKSVYKENVHLSEAISFHTAQSQRLQKKVDALERENASLQSDKELNGWLVQEKVSEAKRHRRQIKDVSERKLMQ